MWQKVKNIYHLSQSVAATYWYRTPLQKMTFIGVTGTDGKTTTSNLIHHILKHAGARVSLISTISAIIGEETLDTGFHVTTPGVFQLQSYIKHAKKDNSDYVILEVTSHALDQNRVHGIPFAVSVLTNVTHEHLDYHKTYENYVRTKAKLLQKSKTAVVNRDDASYDSIKYLVLSSKYEGKVVTYGFSEDADVNPENFPFQTKLIGEFNKYNILAAVGVAIALGIDDKTIREAIHTFEPPVGRTEIVHQDDFTIMVDFAHTPNSLEQLLSTIKRVQKNKGRVIHIFGCAGERDAYKRPEMGRISAEYADIIILTAEDPRSESVHIIIDQIASGINQQKTIKNKQKGISVYKIADRREAIKKAIAMAKKGDMIVLSGKGHEKSMNLGSGEIPWSEHEAVREALVQWES